MNKSHPITLRLTPSRVKKLSPYFREVICQSDAGTPGILAGQFYRAGEYVHERGRSKHAVVRVGFLPHEQAMIVSRYALSSRHRKI